MPTTHRPAAPTDPDRGRASEHALVEALRRGDEAAFARVHAAHHHALVRVARLYVHSRVAAEDVAQETWVAVVQGIGRFEGRSSLRTWIFCILLNRARRRGAQDARVLPLAFPVDETGSRAWTTATVELQGPEDRLLSGETRTVVKDAIAALPPTQRTVITLRDVEGRPAAEVCRVLALTAGNQRVLLHRARTHVRAAVRRYLEVDGSAWEPRTEAG